MQRRPRPAQPAVGVVYFGAGLMFANARVRAHHASMKMQRAEQPKDSHAAVVWQPRLWASRGWFLRQHLRFPRPSASVAARWARALVGDLRSRLHVLPHTTQHENVPCRLSSPQRGHVVSLTICSTVEGAIFEVDLMFASAHHAGMKMGLQHRHAERSLRSRGISRVCRREILRLRYAPLRMTEGRGLFSK